MTVRVGSLAPETPFTTMLTHRAGTVLEGGTRLSHKGIRVELEGPDEERYIHEDVYVQVEGLR